MKRGRPAYKPTAAQRRSVSIAAGGGMSHVEIAEAMGLARNTLEKCFKAELSTAAYTRRLEVLNAMHKAAKGGNVAAQKAYLSMTPNLGDGEASATPSDKKGKKAAAQEAAKTAAVGTSWEDVLPSAMNVTPIRKPAG